MAFTPGSHLQFNNALEGVERCFGNGLTGRGIGHRTRTFSMPTKPQRTHRLHRVRSLGGTAASTRWAALMVLGSVLSGCLSPIALDRAGIAYNESTADLASRQLLLNIARARYDEPIHFSGISNIAATFNFQANAGATPPLTGNNGTTLMPIFGGAASENPTISIVPMEGEEFTRRLLTPLEENKMTLLLRQNFDVDLLLRLVALEFRVDEQGVERIFHNRPRNEKDYALFRRVVLHLSTIQDRDRLYAEPLVFERRWSLPAKAMTAEALQSLEKEYSVTYDQKNDAYQLSRRVTGRTVITNYSPSILSNEERMRLNEEAEQNSPNDLPVDIRPGFTGGEYPLHGKFRLRSFSNILYFLGRAMSAEPEREVARDPRTSSTSENPVSAMEVIETTKRPADARPFVEYRGHYFYVAPDNGYPWNQTAFRVLSQVFQMTMSPLPRINVPSITIAK
jgi:hypothetical protein